MRFSTRPLGAIALVLVGALSLSACTGEPPADDTATARTSSPDSDLTVIADASEQAASIATSNALFDESAVVVVAPEGDSTVQTLAARASIALGVPLLVSESDETDATAPTALHDELTRLKSTTVLAIGEPEGFAGADSDADSDADADGPDVISVDATTDAVETALGFALPDTPTAGAIDNADNADNTDPAESAESAAPADPAGLATASPVPSQRPAGGDAAIPATAPAPALDDTLALILDGDEQVASLATARSAGVEVQRLETSAPNPQASRAATEALHNSTTTKTLAIGAGFASETQLDWKIRAARTGATLPGGGQLLFPEHQFIALYGTPGTPSMGVLGEQDVDAAIQRAKDVAAPYAALTDKTVVPMFEIIATVASASAGADGNFSNELDPARLRAWIDAAAAEGVYVVLDLQPGRTDFLTQAKQYEELLSLPNVGLAIDPEWRLAPDQVHLQQIGSVDAAEVNAVTQWLADLTNSKALPQKMLVLHQFRLLMLRDRAAIDMSHPELAMLIHADGLGAQPDKQATWRALHQDAPAGIAWGWKNFYDEDAPMLSPEQTMTEVAPLPDLVTYQ